MEACDNQLGSRWYWQDTYALTSSVASLPTICRIALSPPGWYFNHGSTFKTFWSTITMDLPSAMSPSTCLLDSNTSARPAGFLVRGIDATDARLCRSMGVLSVVGSNCRIARAIELLVERNACKNVRSAGVAPGSLKYCKLLDRLEPVSTIQTTSLHHNNGIQHQAMKVHLRLDFIQSSS